MSAPYAVRLALEAVRRGAWTHFPRDLLDSEPTAVLETLRAAARDAHLQRQAARCMDNQYFEFTIRNDRGVVPGVVRRLCDAVIEFGLCDRVAAVRVGVALEEAIVNAIVHGNLQVSSDLRQEDESRYLREIEARRTSSPYADRRVRVTARVSPCEGVFVVQDDGPGFDLSRVPDPTDPENIMRVGGRGILLMRAFMSSVHFNEAGNRVTMVSAGNTTPGMSMFDPAGVRRLGYLKLGARQVVGGFLTGRHRSPYHGFSVEYLDHRPYVPGDELRALDWKVLARTDKYHVKLFEDETNLRATILLDCSRSMGFCSGPISKLQWGSYLAAALTLLLLRQNDAVGVAVFDSRVRSHLPPMARPTQFRRVLELLEPEPAAGDTDLGAVLHDVAERVRRRGLIIVISDLIDDVVKVASGLQHFRHDGHEVVVFQVLDEAELSFPYDRATRFQDPEGGGQLVANAKALRGRYLERMRTFLEEVRTACAERDIAVQQASTAEGYDRVLAAFLEKRGRMG